MILDTKSVCHKSVSCFGCLTATIPCDDGYTLRLESSGESEIHDYINVYFTTPLTPQEAYWKPILKSTDVGGGGGGGNLPPT